MNKVELCISLLYIDCAYPIGVYLYKGNMILSSQTTYMSTCCIYDISCVMYVGYMCNKRP